MGRSEEASKLAKSPRASSYAASASLGLDGLLPDDRSGDGGPLLEECSGQGLYVAGGALCLEVEDEGPEALLLFDAQQGADVVQKLRPLVLGHLERTPRLDLRPPLLRIPPLLRTPLLPRNVTLRQRTLLQRNAPLQMRTPLLLS